MSLEEKLNEEYGYMVTISTKITEAVENRDTNELLRLQYVYNVQLGAVVQAEFKLEEARRKAALNKEAFNKD